jgi:3-hydroxyisobutyrate dehydrogenase-like beta-hydroxyacid dehydrogenase
MGVPSAAIGVIGLGVMGSSLCLNLAENASCRVAGIDLSAEKVRGSRAPGRG